MSQVTLEVTLYEQPEGGPPYAEWEMWREWPDMDNLRASEWITQGTAPTLEAAIDKALGAYNTGDRPE